MTTRVIQTEADLDGLTRLLRARKRPFTVEVVDGKRRSVEQNRLQRRLINEIAEQTGQTPEEVRAFCKLTLGVPILRAESEVFAEKYDRLIRPRSVAEKLELMAEPFDFPVTRLMTTKQKTAYLDAILAHFAGLGVVFSADREAA